VIGPLSASITSVEKKDVYECDPIWLERLKRFRTVGYVGRQVIQRHNCDNAR
jgi:hypothetical protein